MSDPRRVLLFSGHMVDRPNRKQDRFPARMEGVVALRMLEVLQGLEAGPGDLGICGGAAGGDLIFAEACLGRDVEIELLLPQAEEAFLEDSVRPSGTGWEQRYRQVAEAAARIEVMPDDHLAGSGLGLYARHGRWLLERALALGPEKLVLVALWDGRPGDGSGGTADVVAAARGHTERVHIISPG